MAVIMVSHFFPFPPRVGAEIRTANILKTLSELTDVILISNNDGSGDVQEAKKYAREVISVAPLGFGRMKSVLRRLKEPFTAFPAAGRWLNLEAFRKSIYSAGKEHNDSLLWLEASWLLGAIRKDEKRKIVLDQHNLDSEVLNKRAQNAPFPLSQLYKYDYFKQKAFEKQLFKRVSVIMSVSEEEKIAHEKLFQLDNVVVLPNLLELEKYRYSLPNYDSRTIIMTGDFAYEPNRAGARYLVKKILPLVKEQVPDPKIIFAGKGSGSLPLREASVELMGEFDKPEDVFSLASAAAAPIFTGGGSRYKILEALAFGVPVVSTSCGAEGLRLVDGDGLLVRDGERQFADALSSILNDRELSSELSLTGRKKIEEHYSMERCKAVISDVMKKLDCSKKCA